MKQFFQFVRAKLLVFPDNKISLGASPRTTMIIFYMLYIAFFKTIGAIYRRKSKAL